VSVEPHIAVRRITKVYSPGANELTALDAVSFDVFRSTFVSILGASGCGKSTLLKIIAGLIFPTKGEVILDGAEIKGPVRGIGMVFQSPTLLPWRRTLQNVLLTAKLRKLDMNEYTGKAMRLLELTGLKGFESKFPYELSGGMQQRVAICRALLCDPTILLMDEPFGALDAMTRERMNLELLSIWATIKNTVVFVTHSIQEAVLLSDRVVVMTPRPGKIAATVEIDLPRPRGVEMMRDPRFLDYATKIRQLVGLEHFPPAAAID